MQRQHCVLSLRLDRYEAHVRSLYRLADWLGVSFISPVALYERSDELGATSRTVCPSFASSRPQ